MINQIQSPQSRWPGIVLNQDYLLGKASEGFHAPCVEVILRSFTDFDKASYKEVIEKTPDLYTVRFLLEKEEPLGVEERQNLLSKLQRQKKYPAVFAEQLRQEMPPIPAPQSVFKRALRCVRSLVRF